MNLAGVILDTDGVITRTASVHLAAWRSVFDEFLAARAAAQRVEYRAFSDADYRRDVDGVDRYSGVAAFLASRGIELPWGAPEDPPGHHTVCAIGNLKNDAFTDQLRAQGAEAYPGTVRLLNELREAGIAVAAFSASRNMVAVLESAGVADLFDALCDGLDAARLGLAGKPAPDVLVESARRLGLEPARCAVIEDSAAGVAAGRAGGFGQVIGVDRTRHPAPLARHSDLVVPDLADLTLTASGLARASRPANPLPGLPSALSDADLGRTVGERRVAVFLDYDGTLTPIVARPEHAHLPEQTRRALAELAAQLTVGIISGRDLDDVRAMVDLDGLWYAGSHGFDVLSPDGDRTQFDEGIAALPDLDAAEAELRSVVPEVPGAWVERKRFAIAVHHRASDPADVPRLDELVEGVARTAPQLRRTGGKAIFELRPNVEWDKGRALDWVLAAVVAAVPGPEEAPAPSVLPVYVGDDETDEDAFVAIRDSGVGIVVGSEERDTAAHLRIADPAQTRDLLDRLRALTDPS